MGIPDSSLFNIIEKIKSWIWWGEEDKSGVSQEHWNSDNMCCECKVQLMDFSVECHCESCGRVICRKCVQGGLVGEETRRGGVGDLCIRLCKRCECKRRIDSSSTEKSVQSEHLLRFLEAKRHGSVSPSMDNLSPVSFRRSPSRSDDDDLDEPGKHFFSPLSEYYRDIYDIDSEGVNARHEFSCNKSAGSSPFDSPSRMASTPRSGTSLQLDQEGSPLSLNDADASLRQQAMANSRRSEAEFDENPDYGSDELPRLGDQDTKVKQPLDFVSNGLIWVPPPPEDEEDELESSFFDDDDEDDEVGDSGMFTTSSFSTDIFPTKGRASEEQKEPLLAVVRGHFRALVLQLLQGEGIDVDEDDDDSWLDIVTSLAWQAAHFVKPDTRSGGSMDPGDYVKVKRVESGTPSESALIKGVVCTKNIKHKRMTSQYKNPKLLLLGGALEYQRTSNHLASFDTLLQQEIDHLKKVVSKIEAHHPNVLLVEKTVSSYAQDYLLEKDISLVLNVKRSLLERVARCTGAHIVHSVDNLSSTQLGHCEVFRLERVVEGVSQQPTKKTAKTLMFFEGCPRRLGCTVLLRGAHTEVLQKIKRVVQYAVFAAYHLSLETSFIADEGATLLKMPPLKSQIDFSGRMTNVDGDISLVSNSSTFDDFKKVEDRLEAFCECSMSGTSYSRATSNVSSRYDRATSFSTEIDNGSPCLHSNSGSISTSCTSVIDCRYGHACDHASGGNSASDVAQGTVYQSECKYWRNLSIHSSQLDLAESSVPEEEKMLIHHWDSAIDNELIRRSEQGDDNEPATEYLSAVDSHQSILVSLSRHCVQKGVLCERSQLLRIKFYGNFDKPLGRFLRDELFNQTSYCRSCNEPSDAHVRCYTHQQGSLTINVRRLLKVLLPGEHDGKIWMWHRCLKCAHVDGVPPANRRVLMSDAAWGLSFGKFLELSFSNHATANRVASCGHSLQRDCLRFYGFGSMVAFFRYSPIDILSVRPPPLMLEFSSEVQQNWVKREAMKLFDEMEVLFADVFDALHIIEGKGSSLGHTHLNGNEFHDHINDLKVLLKKERNEYESLLHPACTEDPHYWEIELDILELNLLRRCLLMDSYIWDHRLYSLDSLLKTKASILKIDPHILEAETYVKLKEWRDETFFKDVKPGLPSTVSDNPKIQLLSDIGEENPISNELTVDQRIIKSVEKYCMDNERLTSDLNHKHHECNAGLDTQMPSPSLPSPASCLSDKIDSAWTGTGQQPLKPQVSCILQPDVKQVGAVGVMDQIDNPKVERLKCPVRVHSFDSAMRIQEKIRQGSSPSFPLTSLRSFHASGEFRNMVRDPIPSILRTLSQASSRETQKLSSIFNSVPLFIPSASKLAAEGVRLLLPQTGRKNIVVPVYDNEPTSVVAYTLASKNYEDWVADKLDEQGGLNTSVGSREDELINLSRYHSSVSSFSSRQSLGSLDSEDLFSKSHGSDDIPLTLAAMISDQKRSPHFRTSFEDEYSSSTGKVKFSVICYFARQFDALRKKCCPSEVDFIRSLSRCNKWNAQGGKSNVYFAKTFDERFIIKQVTKTELDSFEEYAPQYFKYLTEIVNSGNPTCLAKILGLYQVTVKHLKGGKQTKMELMVMENLFYKKRVTRVYDLKGSARSRYNADTTGKNKVLLDTNLLETLRTNPIFLGSKAKRTLERAVWNDTSFLASVDVMDYSLLVGVDQEGKELVLGIIDFMRQYTWDKHLETWVKASGILGGPKNAPPTVISPLQYKKRFRKAMSTYFLTVPD